MIISIILTFGGIILILLLLLQLVLQLIYDIQIKNSKPVLTEMHITNPIHEKLKQKQNTLINSKYTVEEGVKFRNEITTKEFYDLEIIINQNLTNYNEFTNKLWNTFIKLEKAGMTHHDFINIDHNFDSMYTAVYFKKYIMCKDSIVCDQTEDMREWATNYINEKIAYLNHIYKLK